MLLIHIHNTGDPITTPNGLPAAGCIIDCLLVDATTRRPCSAWDAISGELFTTATATITCDEHGEIPLDAETGISTLQLWPNDRGSAATMYRFTARNGEFTPFMAALASAPTTQTLIQVMAGGTPLTPAELSALRIHEETPNLHFPQPTVANRFVKTDADGNIEYVGVAPGMGDMAAAFYDTDEDGKVNAADEADAAPWSGIIGKPLTFPPETHTHNYAPALGSDDNYVTDAEKSTLHSHANKATLDKITEAAGLPLWNAGAWPRGIGGGGAVYPYQVYIVSGHSLNGLPDTATQVIIDQMLADGLTANQIAWRNLGSTPVPGIGVISGVTTTSAVATLLGSSGAGSGAIAGVSGAVSVATLTGSGATAGAGVIIGISSTSAAATLTGAGASPGQWYLSGGIASANCIAAYQPKGAASLSASYTNLAHANHTLTPTVAPTFDADGWVMTGTQYLTTDMVPDTNWSAIVRYSGVTAGVAFGNVQAGSGFGVSVILAGGQYHYCGGYISTTPSNPDAGVSAIVGYNTTSRQVFKNGTSLGQPAAGGGNPPGVILIGTMNGTQYLLSGKIQAIAFYDVTLTSAQVTAITSAIQSL